MDWDDLRIFLAVAKAGTLAGAARELGVNHSTVFRRINAFEEKQGVRMFERIGSGYALTAAGEEMQASALRVEAEIDRLDRRISGRDLRLSGPVAVTTTDTLSNYLLGPHLKKFKDAFPDILIELLLDTHYVNLSKRLADVAIRVTTNPPEALVGRRISGVAFAAYAAKDYVGGTAKPLDRLDWLTLDDSLAHLGSVKWVRAHLPDVRVAMCTNNIHGLMIAARHGMGAALLPCFMGDSEERLQRLSDPIPEAGSAIWILTHEDLRHTPRVRAFMDHMAVAIGSEQQRLEGVLV